MTWDDLLAWLRQPESMDLRFFKKDPELDDLAIVMVAMANAEGGTIIIGIDQKNLHFFGSAITEPILRHLVRHRCRNQFAITPSIILRGDKSIVAIQVHESTTKPVFFREACYLYMTGPASFFIAQDPFAVPSIEGLFEDEGQTDLITWTAPEVVAPVDAPPVLVEPEAPQPSIDPVLMEGFPSEPVAEETAPQQTQLFDTLNDRQRQAIVFMKNNPTIRNQVYREMFGISHKTAHIELTELVNKRIFVQEGAGRSTHYVLAT
jgi:predicted HTH transcriptional regulator